MLHLLVILILAAPAMRDAAASATPGLTPAGHAMSDAAQIGAELWLQLFTTYVVLPLLAWLWCVRCARRLDRTGSVAALASADGMMGMLRWGVTAGHGINVLALGWLDAVRAAVGDLIFIDEGLCALPALLAIVSGWASYYPIERRVREARFFGALERGETVYPPRSRWQYVTDQARHHVLFVAAPMSAVLAWSEAASWAADRWARPLSRLVGEDSLGLMVGAAQLAGAAAVFLFAPAVVRRVWSTRALAPGPLRDALLGLCARHAVRVRELLVWRTHGTMINGAVMGLLPRLRYILLTDALLDSLGEREVEAVLAHELGHVRRRHIPWLVASLIVAVGLGLSAAEIGGGIALWAAAHALQPDVAEQMRHAAAAGGVGAEGGGGVRRGFAGLAMTLLQFWPLMMLPVAFMAMGGVSRRFERQADAFAVAHLSGLTADPASTRGRAVTPDAVAVMAGALGAVAALNAIPLERRFWRHGSLRGRIDAIRSLVGVPLDRIPIDRMVRRDKIAAAAGLAVLTLLNLAAWRVGL